MNGTPPNSVAESAKRHPTGARGCSQCTEKMNQFTAPRELAMKVRPKLIEEWDSSQNPSHVSLGNYTAGSDFMAFWKCSKGHTWNARIKTRCYGRDCPYCANKAVWKGYNDLASQFPLIAAQWHPTLNGDLTPDMVSPRSSKKVWWLCSNGHTSSRKIFTANPSGDGKTLRCQECFISRRQGKRK